MGAWGLPPPGIPRLAPHGSGVLLTSSHRRTPFSSVLAFTLHSPLYTVPPFTTLKLKKKGDIKSLLPLLLHTSCSGMTLFQKLPSLFPPPTAPLRVLNDAHHLLHLPHSFCKYLPHMRQNLFHYGGTQWNRMMFFYHQSSSKTSVQDKV